MSNICTLSWRHTTSITTGHRSTRTDIMSGRVSKTTKRKDRFGIEVLRFRGSKSNTLKVMKARSITDSTPGPTCLTQDETNDIPTYQKSELRPAPESNHGLLMFAATKLPEIPPIPDSLQQQLVMLRSPTQLVSKESNQPTSAEAVCNVDHRATMTVSTMNSLGVDSLPSGQKSNKTKLNGFMAFRAFHSRGISTIEHQRGLSTTLATVWAMSPDSQLVWQRYATEYNAQTRYEPSISFVQWLLGITGKGDYPEKSVTQRTFERSTRVENVYLADDGDITCQPASKSLTSHGGKHLDDSAPEPRFIESPPEAGAVLMTRASSGSSRLTNIDPVVYELDQKKDQTSDRWSIRNGIGHTTT